MPLGHVKRGVGAGHLAFAGQQQAFDTHQHGHPRLDAEAEGAGFVDRLACKHACAAVHELDDQTLVGQGGRLRI